MELTQEEISKYSRQILIPEFGMKGQAKLKNSSVLVVGCGGLGSPVLLYLTAAGIGKIGIVENDKVDLSNLQRQIMYSENSVGRNKIEETEERLKKLNKNVNIEKYSSRLTAKNALEIVEKYDVIVDGSDNFPTRYLINDACVLKKKPLVYGAIYRFEGQVSVFNYLDGPTYRDLFITPPSEEMAPNCATAGVLGMMAGIIGSIQATEVVKILTGIGEVLSGKLLLFDALSMSFRKISVNRNPNLIPITELIDYEAFCGFSDSNLKRITFKEFKERRQEITQLIDVREPEEYTLSNLGGQLMPLSELELHLSEIKRDGVVVVHCQSGVRSKKAIQILSEKHGFNNLINLEGGINASDS